jgi:hypothetical protein
LHPSNPRPDVLTFVGDERAARAGWLCLMHVGRIQLADAINVVFLSSHGDERVVEFQAPQSLLRQLG